MTVDVYAYWRALVAGKSSAEAVDLVLPTIKATIPGENPQAGLWKVRPRKGEGLVLMQIWLTDDPVKCGAVHEWRDGLVLCARVGNTASVDAYDIAGRWLFVRPCSKEHAAHWRQHGRWPDDAPELAHKSNAPGDPFEALLAEVAERLQQAAARLEAPVVDQDTCNMARNLQAELSALEGRADEAHKKEKGPILLAGRAIDERYRFRDQLAQARAALGRHYGAWMAAEEKRINDERARAYREQLAAQEAERKRLEEERAAKLRDEPVLALTDPPAPPPPPPPQPPAPVMIQAGGGVGRRAGLATEYIAEITDYRAAALHVIEDPSIAILVGKTIQRLVKAAKGNITIPGVTIREQRKAS